MGGQRTHSKAPFGDLCGLIKLAVRYFTYDII